MTPYSVPLGGAWAYPFFFSFWDNFLGQTFFYIILFIQKYFLTFYFENHILNAIFFLLFVGNNS
jgi:hypothetical protein